MTTDELADALAANMAEVHEKIGELPDGQVKRKADRLARIAHGALNGLKELAAEDGHIQPFSGGEPKPEP